MRALISIPLLCIALNAAAGCPVEHPRKMPLLPDGAVAGEAEMRRAQLAADNYILQAQTYLGCDMMNRRQHNTLLAEVEVFSAAFNEELIEFQVRSHMIAGK